MYLPFLPCFSLLSSAICKAFSDNHVAFLHFFLFGIVLVTASYTMLQFLFLFPITCWVQICFPLYYKEEIALKASKRRANTPQGLPSWCPHPRWFYCFIFFKCRWNNLAYSWEEATFLRKFLMTYSVFVYFSSVCFGALFKKKSNISLFFLTMDVWKDTCDRYGIVQSWSSLIIGMLWSMK